MQEISILRILITFIYVLYVYVFIYISMRCIRLSTVCKFHYQIGNSCGTVLHAAGQLLDGVRELLLFEVRPLVSGQREVLHRLEEILPLLVKPHHYALHHTHLFTNACTSNQDRLMGG